MSGAVDSSVASLRSRPLLSDRAFAGQSSAIRDLLDQAKRPGMISLAGGLPDATSFPRAELADIAQHVLADEGVLQYGPTAGDEQARSALATLFGSDTAVDDVVVTTGSQQALDLIARCVVNPGDQVVAGDPDYLGALQVFNSYGAAVRPISIDCDGINTDQLEDALQWGLRPKCCYTVPNFHNPTGASLSRDRRLHLQRLAARYGFLIIEDDPYRELRFDQLAAPDFEVDPAHTVRLRSTSKTLAPGLRIGALSGPDWLLDAVVTAKQSVDLHTSGLSQAVVATALQSSWYPAHLATVRALYRSKRDTLVQSMHDAFGDNVSVDVPLGGMFLWVRFDHVADTAVWLQRCLDTGVCFVPGSAFAVSRDLSNFARFSFATGSPDELHEAVGRMQLATRLPKT